MFDLNLIDKKIQIELQNVLKFRNIFLRCKFLISERISVKLFIYLGERCDVFFPSSRISQCLPLPAPQALDVLCYYFYNDKVCGVCALCPAQGLCRAPHPLQCHPLPFTADSSFQPSESQAFKCTECA